MIITTNILNQLSSDDLIFYKQTGIYRNNPIQPATMNDINNIVNQISINTSGITAFLFNNYTGNTKTILNDKVNTTTFNNFTGNTTLINFYNKNQINSYTGKTNIILNNLTGSSSLTNYYNKNQINSYTAETANLYYTKSQINAYSAETINNINNRLLTTTFNIFTGNTNTNFNTFTGITLQSNFYNKSQINLYTGETNTILSYLNPVIGIKFVSSVAFDHVSTVYSAFTNSTILTITPNSVNAKAGNQALMRVTGDGINNITFSGFNGSDIFNNALGQVNLISFIYDGTDYWYSITYK